MLVATTPPEDVLMCGVMRSARNYLEFGAGSSTVKACSLVRGGIITVDSSQDWLDVVRDECVNLGLGRSPDIHRAFIGPVGEWGYPAGESCRAKWPSYHTGVWSRTQRLQDGDVCMVDGRFRVACTLQALLHSDGNPMLLFHDFTTRPNYHEVLNFAREVAAVETLVVLQRRADFNAARAQECLDRYSFDAA